MFKQSNLECRIQVHPTNAAFCKNCCGMLLFAPETGSYSFQIGPSSVDELMEAMAMASERYLGVRIELQR